MSTPAQQAAPGFSCHVCFGAAADVHWSSVAGDPRSAHAACLERLLPRPVRLRQHDDDPARPPLWLKQ